MEQIRNLSYQTIHNNLFRAAFSVYNNILKPFKINRNTITNRELLNLISDDIKDLGFIIKMTKDTLFDEVKRRKVPGFIRLNTQNRRDGGVIKLNETYPRPVILETLFHEYAHIKDRTLPVLPMDVDSSNVKSLYFKLNIKRAEFIANMIAFTLMMPPEKLRADLIESAYNIDCILEKYKDFDKCSVLWWLTLIDCYLPCHFSWIKFETNSNNKAMQTIGDSYYYDHKSDPKPFDISTVLANKDSAAAIAKETKSREGVHKATNINGIDYYCYAYYESDLSEEAIDNPDKVFYDRLLVIGWKKDDYDLVQMYKSME